MTLVFVSTEEMKYSGDVLEVVQNTQSTFLSSLKIRVFRSRIFDADKTLKKSRSTLSGYPVELPKRSTPGTFFKLFKTLKAHFSSSLKVFALCCRSFDFD